MPEQNEMNWILPPNLYKTFQEFIGLYNSLQGDNVPILIIGPRGVGKTLFAKTFAKLYERDHEGSETKTVNIAAMPDTLIEAELFGYKKGAFTGANSNKKGFIEEAPNGVLILEEIGELKPEVQSKLLTFIEDHKYYRVGDSKEREAKNIQIIATTNRPRDDKDFRRDFIDRFFPFYIPPLHKRREDVLYYLANKFPDIIRELRPWEILTLLAYDWPGNVREIETIGRVICWQKNIDIEVPGFEKIDIENIQNTKLNSMLNSIPKGYSEIADDLLSIEKYDMTLGALKKSGIETTSLEILLNEFNLGMDTDRGDTPFEGYITSYNARNENDEKFFDVKICPIINEFQLAFAGIAVFYGVLFLQDIRANKNMFDVGNGTKWGSIKDIDSFSQLIESVTKLKVSLKKATALIDGTWAFVKSRTEGEHGDPDIFNMTYKELLEYYFNGMFNKAGGNKAETSRLTGVSYSTIKKMLRNK